jgi:hypothetical protein
VQAKKRKCNLRKQMNNLEGFIANKRIRMYLWWKGERG